MADTKRKSKPKPNSNGKMKKGQKKSKNSAGKSKSTGPRLPAAMRKQLDVIRNPNLGSDDDDFEGDVNGVGDVDSDEGLNVNDLYEYEEEVAEEDSKKNRRFDPVENFEYELPEKFKDEDIPSEDDNDDDFGGEDDEKYSDDDERHARMLQNITGIPVEAFKGSNRNRKASVSEAYPESEFNPTGDGQITINDILEPLSGTSGFSKVISKAKRSVKKGITVQTPLPKPVQDKLEREIAYDKTKEELTKWEPIVKMHRETPTLSFDNRNVIKAPTVGTIASEFKPRTSFEKTISSLMHDDEIMDAYRNDGVKLLEMNKISVEDVKDRQDKLAKMRSLLFYHEMKAKKVKKIKSKTYHRLKNKDKRKLADSDSQIDPEAAKELAEKQERIRAKERMTLRHKNQGKWVRRKLERGLDKQDEGTRASIAEQLHIHNSLTRKINSVKDGSSSDDTTDEDDEDFDSSDEEGASKLVAKAKEKTLRLMEQDEEVPDSGVFSLPFMVRGMEKRKEAANEEAKRALEEYELSLEEQEENAAKGPKHGTLSGRRVFGATQTKVEKPKRKERPEVDNYGSENEDIIEEDDNADVAHGGLEGSRVDKDDDDINLDVLRKDFETVPESVLESRNDIVVEDPESRTSFDVSVFTSGSWKKMKTGKDKKDHTSEGNVKRIPEAAKPSLPGDVREDMDADEDEDSDSDSGGQMVDGMLSAGAKQTYELPSNEELIRRAFAGDDVEEEFHKAKEDVLNEENPEPEKPLLLPGWGQWASVQKKKGLPSWMLKEHADAKQKREAALKKRKDARLNHVIISEKIDKQAEKFHLKALPYPFTSQEVYERSNRMPLGPEYNPASVAGDLTRPEVIKKAGVFIPPISFQEVDPHEKGEETKQGKKRRRGNSKSTGKKPMVNKKTKA